LNRNDEETATVRPHPVSRLEAIPQPKEETMPWKTTLDRARRARAGGKRPTTQAGEFVREEMEHVRRGKHGARSTKQAIAIGLSKARRAGVELPPPRRGKRKTIESARRAYASGRRGRRQPAPRRSRAIQSALKREGRSAASRTNLARQARQAARARRRLGPATPGVRPLKSSRRSRTARGSRRTQRKK
jgi:hypothetical protein